jgi:hypothetical protein
VELYKKLRPRVAMRKLRKKKERIGLTMSVEELKEIDKLRGDLSRSEYIKRKIFMSEPRDIFEEDYDKLRGMVTMVGGTLYKIRKFLEQGDLSKINDKEFAKSIIKHVRFSRESIEYYLKNN